MGEGFVAVQSLAVARVSAPRSRQASASASMRVPLPSLQQVCYGALLYTSGKGLWDDALSGNFDRPVALDVFIFAVAALFLRQTFAKVDYTKLDGLGQTRWRGTLASGP